jgi:hypothetical protein
MNSLPPRQVVYLHDKQSAHARIVASVLSQNLMTYRPYVGRDKL